MTDDRNIAFLLGNPRARPSVRVGGDAQDMGQVFEQEMARLTKLDPYVNEVEAMVKAAGGGAERGQILHMIDELVERGAQPKEIVRQVRGAIQSGDHSLLGGFIKEFMGKPVVAEAVETGALSQAVKQAEHSGGLAGKIFAGLGVAGGALMLYAQMIKKPAPKQAMRDATAELGAVNGPAQSWAEQASPQAATVEGRTTPNR
jgi:hypothetical protein